MKLRFAIITVALLIIGVQLNVNLEPVASIPINEMSLSSLSPHDAIVIDGNADLLQQATDEGWLGNGSEASPFLISGYSFDLFTQAIRIFNTDYYWEFRDNVVQGSAGSQCATWVINTTHGAFINNEFYGRGHSALYIEDVTGLIISGNYIHDCGTHGLEAVGLFTDCTIEDNIIEDNGENGLYFKKGIVDSIISNNSIANAGTSSIAINVQCDNTLIEDNILVNAYSSNLYVYTASDSTIIGNNITSSGSMGIKLSNGNSIEISENVITSNTNYGLNLGESTVGITVELNEFYDNSDGCQVCDDGTGNLIRYNYYDDWDSPDDDSDGFVDTPYSLDGSTGNSDSYPLAEPGVMPQTQTQPIDTTPTSTDDSPPPALSTEMLALIVAGVIGIIVVVVLIVKKRV
ncbi:MAG: right-handed parallel beta-helix repeat-containing protein [Candidatus Thorarchaeota archaeon]